jgi:hypothetical protein
MRKISVLLSTAALSLFNSGARAATETVDPRLLAPQPAFVAILALVGIGFLLLLARAPLSGPQQPRRANPRKPALPAFWPTPRTGFALLAIAAITGSLSLA